MITHNGTYLLHATHHGMPIYAATMGGKMVIGGWLLSATLQAIVAAFGSAEGAEVIRKTNDYLNRIATTDPQRALQLANFINEDPMLVCSLVETSKMRWLVGDGKAYIDTEIIPDNTTFMYTKFKVLEIGNDYISCISYADYSSGNRAFGIGSWDGKYFTNHGNYTFFNKTTTKGEIIEYTNNAGKSELKWEGGSESKTLSNVFTSPSSLIIGGISRNGSKNSSPSKGAAFNSYILKHQGIEKNFVPCYTEAYGSGMLDLNTLDFHPNANTEGSFTIAITDKA